MPDLAQPVTLSLLLLITIISLLVSLCRLNRLIGVTLIFPVIPFGVFFPLRAAGAAPALAQRAIDSGNRVRQSVDHIVVIGAVRKEQDLVLKLLRQFDRVSDQSHPVTHRHGIKPSDLVGTRFDCFNRYAVRREQRRGWHSDEGVVFRRSVHALLEKP